MTTDPYMDAINAGAAALAKPYRDPDTISAFVETFPTIAAARVIDAALPHLRATIIAEAIPPGPCAAFTEFGHEAIFANGNDTPRQLRALCDLRAGHGGQHEAEDPEWGNFRWTDPANTRCVAELWEYTGEQTGHLRCERTFMHPGYCINGVYVWDDQLNQVLPHEE